jgi:protein O-mannosyl-transferase
LRQIRTASICLALFAVTVAVYFPLRNFAFTNYDDPDYVTGNPHVRDGITGDGLVWALTSGDAANWFPVTRVSHMLDVQLFGLDSGWHHMTNVLLHALAMLFLFAFLNRATRAPWPSAAVALVFAIHPLHVESVAWIAERKDVLCALFWFISLWAYVRYTERPAVGRYLFLLAAFCFGLMSKPMIVTLPFILMLIDFWPLRRKFNLREKLPLLTLAAASAAITVVVQKGSGAVESFSAVSLVLRIQNAAISYIIYIASAFRPTGLAVFYPYPAEIPIWETVCAVLGVVAISGLVLTAHRKYPYLAVGWFWYLGTLVPVIGLVQVGSQSHADRYMYVPLVGIAIMVAWGAADLVRARPSFKIPLVTASAALGICCLWLTSAQAAYWKNSETLFQHALDVTQNNAIAEHNLGSHLLDETGRLPEAIPHLQAALRMNPNSSSTHSDLGTAMAKSGRFEEAISEYQAALRGLPEQAPGSTIVRNNLASAQLELGRASAPESAEAHYNKGIDLAREGRLNEAISEYETALRLRPDYADAHNNLGVALTQIPGRASEARDHFQAAVKFDPGSANAHLNLGVALSQIPGHLPEAIAQLEASYRLHPDPELRRQIDQVRGGQ